MRCSNELFGCVCVDPAKKGGPRRRGDEWQSGGRGRGMPPSQHFMICRADDGSSEWGVSESSHYFKYCFTWWIAWRPLYTVKLPSSKTFIGQGEQGHSGWASRGTTCHSAFLPDGATLFVENKIQWTHSIGCAIWPPHHGRHLDNAECWWRLPNIFWYQGCIQINPPCGTASKSCCQSWRKYNIRSLSGFCGYCKGERGLSKICT